MISYSNALWGITGTAILCTAIAYLVRACLSQRRVQEQVRRDEARVQVIYRQNDEERQEAEARYEELFATLFPNLTMDDLESFPENLSGETGYFDQHQVLEKHFDKGVNVIRGKQAERPFLAVKLAIHEKSGSKSSVILLIAPSPAGFWWVHKSFDMALSIHSNISDKVPETEVSLEWLSAILNGEKRRLLQQDKNWKVDSPNSFLIEKKNGPKVSLWK